MSPQIPKELQKENEYIINMIYEHCEEYLDKGIDGGDVQKAIIDDFASEMYKAWLSNRQKRAEKMLKVGIIEN